MKATFIGGGAHRLLQILRGTLADPEILRDGEINLYDPNARRAEVMVEMLRRTPEHRRCPVRIVWGTTLDEALEGASVVSVVLMAGSPLRFALGNAACWRHGFIGSDNVSPAGAFLAMKTVPIVLDIARRMERLCPDAWLLDFANPVAVMSAAVNRHTRIKALGVCQGFTNHRWDLSRIFGRDEDRADFEVETAGVNHLSFVVRGSAGEKDLFAELDRVVAGDWAMPPLDPRRSEADRRNVTASVTNLVRFYWELGVMIFSTEGDGMAHLYHDEYVAEEVARRPPPSPQEVEAEVARTAAARAEANRVFEAHLQRDLDDEFWQRQGLNNGLKCARDDIFIRALRGISGRAPAVAATSRLNQGAIQGIPDDAVVEYSQRLFKDRIEPLGRYEVPRVVHGLVDGLSVHQTMLADACVTGDPRLLAHALLAYPIRSYSREAKALCRELFEIHRDEIDPRLGEAAGLLR